ncbi:helix-turn-helix domain-containing protein [Rhodospira trueperi]|nr:helix-turn-helix transcriptional regulator [Rhodospira trueperi]
MDLIVELERDHPDLAAEAPISSVALEIGEMVREKRLVAGMSQRELAEAAGLHQSAISAMERGDGKDGPTYRKLRAIAEALGMRLEFVPRDQWPFSSYFCGLMHSRAFRPDINKEMERISEMLELPFRYRQELKSIAEQVNILSKKTDDVLAAMDEENLPIMKTGGR